jgi:NAD+ synthase (glutamine-hydrolysing)
MDSLRIALAQIDATVGDFAGNTARIGKYIDDARENGADLVIFPELILTGYPPGDLLLRSAFIAANQTALSELAERTFGITAVIGSLDYLDQDSGIFNAATILHNGKVVGASHKEWLSHRPILEEPRYFELGRADNLYQLAGYSIGIVIGDDLAPNRAAIRRLAEAGADLVVNLDSAPFHRNRLRRRHQELAEAAEAWGVAIAYVNRIGGQDELVFDGGSLVLDSSGEILTSARPFQEELLLADLPPATRGQELADTNLERARPGALAPAVPASEAEKGVDPTPIRLVTLERGVTNSSRTVLPERPPVRYDELAEIYQALAIGIRDYARKNGFRHVALGLSGGLDSALVATLAADALGAEAVTGVWMPSPYSSEISRVDAADLAERLGIELRTIPIEPAFDSFMDLLGPQFGDRGADLTEENLQARIRGILLMALSNKFGWLILSTSNKSETAVGYTTLYGDMVGGLAVLKDLTKTLVFELARWRNREVEVIPWRTIERPPSAELRPDQLDTDSLPSYDLLDPVLEQYL